MMKPYAAFSVFILILAFQMAAAQDNDVNYDESHVPEYQLPSLFETPDGSKAETVDAWEFKRRPEIVKLFEENVYGQVPAHYDGIRFEIVHEDQQALNGTAHLKEVDIEVTRNHQSISIRLNMFVPNDIPRPAPVFLWINYRDVEIADPSREVKTEFWPVEEVIARGYAIGAFQVGDVADDDEETFQNDILQKLYPEQIGKPDGMRALSAWAWGAMRVMDYFVTDPDIDQHRSVLTGHSRSSKAGLWAGAQDQRFSIIVSNESGAGGAALSRRRFGETVQIINTAFPHWFTPNFENYNENEEALPVDQHMLIGAIAPRPVYVASAVEDKWADPRGEFLALKYGSEIHSKIYQLPVTLPDRMPEVNSPLIQSYAGYHIREGGHGLTLYDWHRFMDFADYHFGLNQTTRKNHP